MLSITISHELSTVVEAKDIEAKDANGMLLVREMNCIDSCMRYLGNLPCI